MAGRHVFAALILLLALASGAASAQTHEAAEGPYAWSNLSSQQRTALAPLSHDWDDLSDFRKQKWLGIAKRYSKLGPVEQARMQDRMREWVDLTPSQREIVRNQFKVLRSAPVEAKNELGRKWQEYAALPTEEKKRLADSAPRPRVTAIPTIAGNTLPLPLTPYTTAAPKVLSQTPPGGKSRPLTSAQPR